MKSYRCLAGAKFIRLTVDFPDVERDYEFVALRHTDEYPDGPAGLAAPAKRATSRTFSGNGQIAPGTCAPWRMGTFLLFVWYQVRLGRHSYLPLRDTLKGIHRSCAAFVALNLRPAETSLNHLIDDFFSGLFGNSEPCGDLAHGMLFSVRKLLDDIVYENQFAFIPSVHWHVGGFGGVLGF